MTVRVLQGDCRDVLKTLPDESVHCVVTSPPYFGLRDYGADGQLGLEDSPDAFVMSLIGVFAQVWRVLRSDGTAWLNLGDSYASPTKGSGGKSNSTLNAKRDEHGTVIGKSIVTFEPRRFDMRGLKQKDLIGIPWRVALALQEDGWWLRQDIIWSKPNPMPESVTDRCTKSHEYIFLLSKGERYYFDAAAIAEPLAESSVERLSQPTLEQQRGSDRVPGKTNGPMKAVGTPRNDGARWNENNGRGFITGGTRNKRSVWNVPTQGFPGAHFATFPPDLIEPCILAGCPEGGTVLDPFGGAGTTGLVADRHKRDAILIELNPEYAEMARKRIYNDAPLFADVA
jgi:DNA modification methylase